MIRLINDFAVLYAESTGCAREILSELWRSNNIMDHLSRFQVITKVPYPSLGDSWIDEKRKRSEQWYSWQTGLRLVQAYGRSVTLLSKYSMYRTDCNINSGIQSKGFYNR